jgi:hypothetical protein
LPGPFSGKPFAKRNANKNVDMKMKMKACLIAATIFLTASVKAQNARIEAGLNLANVSVTDNGRVDDANMLTSFRVGIVGDIKLAPMVAFQPGLYYTGKGSKLQKGQPGDVYYFKQTVNPFYFEVPANFVFKFPFAGESHFFVGAGPYIAMGISGKQTTDGTLAGAGFHSEKSIEFSNDDPTTFNQEEDAGLGVMKRFDYGANGVVGISGKSLVLSANYGLGLAKLQSGSNNGADNNNKHRVISINVGFRL